MAQVIPGRMTHDYDGELVVFLIGMRINQPWRPDLWWPVFQAIPGMVAELSADPDSGMLGSQLILHPRAPWLVQYWSSQEKLYAYASNPKATHRPAWMRFNQAARKAPGAVGIWHETHRVSSAESMYVGMPTVGLAQATRAVPVARKGETARARADRGRTKAA